MISIEPKLDTISSCQEPGVRLYFSVPRRKEWKASGKEYNSSMAENTGPQQKIVRIAYISLVLYSYFHSL